MAPQRLDGVEGPRELRLAQGGVDFFVANVMQQHDRPAFAAFQFWNQVVQALRHIFWDLATAERADRQGRRLKGIISLGSCVADHLASTHGAVKRMEQGFEP